MIVGRGIHVTVLHQSSVCHLYIADLRLFH